MMNEIGGYQIIKSIGRGSTCKVFMAREMKTQQVAAIKIVPKKLLDKEHKIIRFREEIKVMKTIDHPLLVPIYEFFEDEYNNYIVMEYVPGGTLIDKINKEGGLSEKVSSFWFRQIAEAVYYMHSQGTVMHRDLKCENILFDRHNNIRIADFGLSKSISSDSMFLTPCGTPGYAAPEIMSRLPYTPAADVWSLGVLLYGMVCGVLPFVSANFNEIVEKVLNEEPDFPYYLSKSCKEVLSGLLCKNVSKRMTIEQLLCHRWLSQPGQNFDALSRIHINLQLVDLEIVQQMSAYGFNCISLIDDINGNNLTHEVGVYRQLRRLRVSRQLREMVDLGRHQTEHCTKSQPFFKALGFQKEVENVGVLSMRQETKAKTPVRQLQIAHSPKRDTPRTPLFSRKKNPNKETFPLVLAID